MNIEQISQEELAGCIDHTLLDATATKVFNNIESAMDFFENRKYIKINC